MLNPNAGGGEVDHCKMVQKNWKMAETLAHGYSSERTQQALSNQYQHDRVKKIFKNVCALLIRMKVASALKKFSASSIRNIDMAFI